MGVKNILTVAHQNVKKLIQITVEIEQLFLLPMAVSKRLAIANLSAKLHILITAITEQR